jgi:hypothetical protein
MRRFLVEHPYKYREDKAEALYEELRAKGRAGWSWTWFDVVVQPPTWEPHPGHHDEEEPTYVHAPYRGMECELFHHDGVWDWSFYDDNSPDPETAVSRGSSEHRANAEWDLCDYILGYVGERL